MYFNMATGKNDSFCDLIQLDAEVQELVNVQETFQHLTQTTDNTQQPVMSTPLTSHKSHNPFTYGDLSTIYGTPQYRPPVPPRTSIPSPSFLPTQNTPPDPHNPFLYGYHPTVPATQDTTSFTNTIPLTSINVSSVPPNPSYVIPPPAQFSASVPNPMTGNVQTSPTSQSNPFSMQQSNQIIPSNPFVGSVPQYTFNSTNPFLPTLSTPVTITHDIPVLKPKEVTLLRLSELIGIAAHNMLNIFFRQVESCTTSDDKRREIAMTRVESDIATLLTAEAMKLGNNLPWSEMKRIMQKRFVGTTKLLHAWQEVTALTYYSDIPPSSFINQLQCKISALQLKFPNEEIPTSDKFLKTKIYKGLNAHAQAKLVDFLADHIPLHKFIDYAEEEYYKELEFNSFNGNRVLPISGSGSPQSVKPVNNNPQVGTPSNEIEKLKKKVEELSKIVGKNSVKKTKTGKYCAFCRVDDHNITECPFHPPRGVCFDCYQPNRKRGHDGCPGPVNLNNDNEQ